MRTLHKQTFLLASILLVSGCATTATSPSASAPVPPTTIEAVGQLTKAIPFPRGYLDPAALPNSLTLLPP
ncbi:acid phosphatase, partial [Sphingobium yanoikuyae]